MRILLASRSPRRRKLLTRILPRRNFLTWTSRILEKPRAGETPRAFVRRMAQAKARQAWEKFKTHKKPPALIIAADTVIDDQGQIIGRPRSRRHAAEILRRLSGRSHQVITAICLMRTRDERCFLATAASRVWMKKISPQDITRYIASGEPLDKAGAYGIQGRGRRLIARHRGSYTNIVGLPVATLRQLLRRAQ